MTPIETARAAWGSEMPDWVAALAMACTRTSQAAVARKLDRSGAVISQVIRNEYAASTTRIEERVRGVLMDGIVECPALGPLPTDKCQDWRQKAGDWAWGSPLRTRMYRACRACPRYRKEAGDG